MVFVFAVSIFLILLPGLTSHSFSVNKIIADLSFEEKYDTVPLQTSSEIQRVQAHLEYAEAFIRHQIQPENNYSKKLDALDRLNYYWKQGEFPQHDKTHNISGTRNPRFIDHRNVYCAVGYLVLTSTGFEQLPKEINNKNEYSYIEEIKNKNLEQWMHSYGFTNDELALIQPTYSYRSEEEQIEVTG
ncbi:hypothetical protein I4U23_004011 [Adineta vaga]|nr:hypothetical protein I4U23_004011 [Adineta vaga]